MELKMDDLFITCSKCKGAKNISEIRRTGSGIGIASHGWQGPCPECEGQGGKLTENGKTLRAFFQMLKANGFVS